MVRFNILKEGAGFGLQIFGIIWSFFDRTICDSLCGGNSCFGGTIKCFGLFLFVGIIFIVCGYSIITMKPKKKKRIKRRIKKFLK